MTTTPEVLPDFKVLGPKQQRGGNYIQTPQPKLVLFSWAKVVDQDSVQQLFKLVMCRDYLGDVLWTEETGNPTSVYGFNWTKDDPKLDRDKTRLLIEPAEDDFHLFFRNLDIIHHIEEKNKWELTRLVPSKNKYILVEGDPKWMASIPLISLYSFLIKCCGFEYKDMSNWWEELSNFSSQFLETQYAVKWEHVPIILDSLDFLADPDVPVCGRRLSSNSESIYTIHNCSGIGAIYIEQLESNKEENEYYKRVHDLVKKAKKKKK